MDLYNIYLGRKDGDSSEKKMLTVRTVVMGRGNGSTTGILNLDELTKALGRPASYIAKYIALEVYCLIKSGEKYGYKFNGAHSAEKLGGVIDKFIKKYVECYVCGCYQTELIVNMESQTVDLKCGDCGVVSEVTKDCRVKAIFGV